jgi:acyl-CoA dehydrogenase
MFLSDGQPGNANRARGRVARPRLRGRPRELVHEDCRVADEAILGEEGRGYHYAQVRLGPARLTHCMRWLGLAGRALEYATARVTFGRTLGEHGIVREMLADCAIDLETSRLLPGGSVDDRPGTRRRAGVLARQSPCGRGGLPGRPPRRAALRQHRRLRRRAPIKVAYGDQTFRNYEGPTETHKWAIGRWPLREAAARAVS